jgi:predicted RNase H-like HicB family nuclease
LDGDTETEAIDDAVGAVEKWIKEAVALGRAVPAPSRRTVRV